MEWKMQLAFSLYKETFKMSFWFTQEFCCCAPQPNRTTVIANFKVIYCSTKKNVIRKNSFNKLNKPIVIFLKSIKWTYFRNTMLVFIRNQYVDGYVFFSLASCNECSLLEHVRIDLYPFYHHEKKSKKYLTFFVSCNTRLFCLFFLVENSIYRENVIDKICDLLYKM